MTYKDLLFVTLSALLIFSASAKDKKDSSEEVDEDWEDWTCQQCSDGAIGVGNYYIQRAQIAEQGKHLLKHTDLCEAHPNPEGCKADWPEFWAKMGPFVWRSHFSYLCDDRTEECGPIQKNDFGNLTMSDDQSRPSCDSCYGRVDGALGYLSGNETITGWADELVKLWPCTEFDTQEECHAYFEGDLALIFDELVDWKKEELALEWCVYWGSCTEKDAEDLDKKISKEDSSEEVDEDWEDWTCQQCSDGAIGVGNYYIQRAQIAEQGKHLLKHTDVCEAHPNPKGCKAAWPKFWATMGPFVWRSHFSYLCDDRVEECGPVQENDFGNLTMSDDQSRPSCDSCFARVDSALGYLNGNETITGWADELGKDTKSCTEFDTQEECHAYFKGDLALIFDELVDWKKEELALEWCVYWGSCTEKEAEKLE